ncbi:uncharacterized protein LTR77_006456 [Saxophila tyrrhenica]|uniref:Signal recognition particle subunit SRP14 n=1 Tax=Saxophila tyrrhenica TaxID=1690608 RepID=A0AAV9PB23_9PEZI|nr:hypothetical protein LTR77_006456 [Saxophila tyrrhenica]
MAKAHLSHDEFFTQLATLLENTQKAGHGSVHLNQKRSTSSPPTSSPPQANPSPVTHDTTSAPTSPAAKVPDDPLWDLHPPEPLPIIVRATDGKSTKNDKKTKNPDKVKLSTVVQPDEIEGFFARYADVCKAGMQGLKKRDRSKRKKDKGRKKKGGAGEGEKKA